MFQQTNKQTNILDVSSFSFLWLYVYVFAIYSMVHCGSAFEPRTFGLPYYCTSIRVRSWCNWPANLWILNPQKKNNWWTTGPYARTWQDHAEWTSCNLNRGGDECHRTHTELKQAEDQQARAWVPRGGGVRQTTRDRVTRGGGADNTCPCQWGGEQATSQTHTPTHHTYNQGTHWYAQTSHHPHTNNLSKNNLMCHSYSFQRRVELAQGWIFPSRMWVPNLGTLLTIALDSLTHFLSSRVEFLLKTDSGYPKDKGGYFIRPGNLWKSPSL